MESENCVGEDELKAAHENGVHVLLPTSAEECITVECGVTDDKMTEIAVLCERSESDSKMHFTPLINSPAEQVKEGGEKETADHSHQDKQPKNKGRSENEKPSAYKNMSSTLVKQNRGYKKATDTDVKLPTKSKSSYNGQTQLQKQSGKSAGEGLAEKTNLKPAKKGPQRDGEGDSEPSLSHIRGDAKPRKFGTLPEYGFSFRCNERAEKRKEFYSKLEEKTQAKEEEKYNLQAKSKETQEAEMKVLRKSLTFKATPMPSFYKEPPPKTELKKIPTTRARSPKLGRKKSSTIDDCEGCDYTNEKPFRHSLDEIGAQHSTTRGHIPTQPEKPARKSLPQLPSQRTALSNRKKAGKQSAFKVASQQETTTSSETSKKEETTLSNAMTEEKTFLEESEEAVSPQRHLEEALSGEPIETEIKTRVSEQLSLEE